MAKPIRAASDGLPSPGDIEAACRSLAALKDQLKRLISRPGGGEPGLGLLSALSDDCPDAVIACTPQAEIRVVNGAAARLTGYSTRELQALTVWDLTHASSQAHFDVLWREFLRAGRQRGAYTLRRRDGSPVEVAYCAETKFVGELSVAILRKS
ncbi:MAG TPA: PAS domain-containing protein [Vicinamibacterales bacterium]|nr:PAS domain-containing protein [Vicinamibacterales bacterium]